MAKVYNPRSLVYRDKNYHCSKYKEIEFKGDFIKKNSEDYFKWVREIINKRGGEFLISAGKKLEGLDYSNKRVFKFSLAGYLKRVSFTIEGDSTRELRELLITKRPSGNDYSHISLELYAENISCLEKSGFIDFLGLSRPDVQLAIKKRQNTVQKKAKKKK